jgi:hypothetical protein
MVQTRIDPPKNCRCGDAPDIQTPCTSAARMQARLGCHEKDKSDLRP